MPTSSTKRFFSLVGKDRLLAHNLIVGAGTMTAGVLGIAFQSLVSHRLSPTDYGAVFATVTSSLSGGNGCFTSLRNVIA